MAAVPTTPAVLGCECPTRSALFFVSAVVFLYRMHLFYSLALPCGPEDLDGLVYKQKQIRPPHRAGRAPRDAKLAGNAAWFACFCLRFLPLGADDGAPTFAWGLYLPRHAAPLSQRGTGCCESLASPAGVHCRSSPSASFHGCDFPSPLFHPSVGE